MKENVKKYSKEENIHSSVNLSDENERVDSICCITLFD